jgi:hypothetical protein
MNYFFVSDFYLGLWGLLCGIAQMGTGIILIYIGYKMVTYNYSNLRKIGFWGDRKKL